MTFPNDFKSIPHPVTPGATQWTLNDSKGKTIISVVGGGIGLYGNGITTFEMWDFREEEPRGYLSTNDINKHLKENPIE
jgi:hypothetical protein